MKTILLAALLVAAPVFAQEYPGDDGYDYHQYNYNQDEQQPPAGPTADDFRNDEALSWNGEWIDTPEYGTVWRPTRVSDGWQPYYYGRWAWTDAGWAWVSDEPFGWAVYHYGRWTYSDVGWLWIPGRVWAPAWVAWRWDAGYAGWCPLGPRQAVYEQPARWVYVPQRRFLEPVRHAAIPLPQRLVSPPPMHGTGPHAGPAIQVVEQATGHAVRPLAVRDASAPHAAQASGGTVQFYRPRTAPVMQGPRPEPSGQPHAQQQEGGPRAAPPHPVYFGGVPAPRQGGQQRPEPKPQAQQPAPKAGAPHAAPPSNSGQNHPHQNER